MSGGGRNEEEDIRFIDALRGFVGVKGHSSSWLSVPEALLLDRRPRGRVRDRVTVFVDVLDDLRRGVGIGARPPGVLSPVEFRGSPLLGCITRDPILTVSTEKLLSLGDFSSEISFPESIAVGLPIRPRLSLSRPSFPSLSFSKDAMVVYDRRRAVSGPAETFLCPSDEAKCNGLGLFGGYRGVSGSMTLEESDVCQGEDEKRCR